ncbi:MAG: hypothetical protein FIB01_11750, partial [Gemmatimonadetes bacterium]|nr:hypothetical protein [Gemmatimonadota bacterium]
MAERAKAMPARNRPAMGGPPPHFGARDSPRMLQADEARDGGRSMARRHWLHPAGARRPGPGAGRALAVLLPLLPALAAPLRPAEAQLTIVLEVPAATPAQAAIHVAGSFNGWNPAAPDYVLQRTARGSYSIVLPAAVRGPIEFKFTLGSWDAVEVDAGGNDITNRAFPVPDTGAARWTGAVQGWRDPQAPRVRVSTAGPGVSVIDTAFAIPQLGRTRRVWLYLPPGYAHGSERYPVLYMPDGQNLFDAATAYAGEWGIDETLDSLAAAGDRGAIVVGIDHGGPQRIAELSPWRNERYGGGEVAEYVAVIVATLMPY